ncbi:MAG: single-stranded DNA-binding protein [Bacteroidales bacterium]
MAGVNKVILIGNLGRDPETHTLESGVKKVSFPLATTETYRNRNGERVDHTEWHNIVMWRNLADIAEKYLTKGSPVYIEGRIRTRSYEQEGVKKYITEILADNMTMLSRGDGSRGEQGPAAEPAEPEAAPEADSVEDDLPF